MPAPRKSPGKPAPVSVEDVRRAVSSGEPPRVILLLGDAGQRSEALHVLLEILVPKGSEAFGLERFDGSAAGWPEIVASARQVAMLADRRVVVVEDPGKAGGDEGDILRFLESPPPGSTLILSGDSWDARKEAGKAARAAAAVFAFEEPASSDLDAVVREVLGPLGKEIAPDAKARLFELAGDARARIRSELEKAALVTGERQRIEIEDVLGSLARSKGHNVFGLTEAVERRDLARALSELRVLLEDGANENYLLAMIEWALRRLLHARMLLGEKVPESEVLARVRVFRDRDGFLRAARGRTREDFHRGFRRLRETDLALKSIGVSAEALLEILVVDLCAPVPKAG